GLDGTGGPRTVGRMAGAGDSDVTVAGYGFARLTRGTPSYIGPGGWGSIRNDPAEALCARASPRYVSCRTRCALRLRPHARCRSRRRRGARPPRPPRARVSDAAALPLLPLACDALTN